MNLWEYTEGYHHWIYLAAFVAVVVIGIVIVRLVERD